MTPCNTGNKDSHDMSRTRSIVFSLVLQCFEYVTPAFRESNTLSHKSRRDSTRDPRTPEVVRILRTSSNSRVLSLTNFFPTLFRRAVEVSILFSWRAERSLSFLIPQLTPSHHCIRALNLLGNAIQLLLSILRETFKFRVFNSMFAT